MCPQMGLKSWKSYFLLKHMKHDIQLLEMINGELLMLNYFMNIYWIKCS